MKGATDGSHFFSLHRQNYCTPGDLCRIKVQNAFYLLHIRNPGRRVRQIFSLCFWNQMIIRERRGKIYEWILMRSKSTCSRG